MVMETMVANVERGSTVYEIGHVSVLTWFPRRVHVHFLCALPDIVGSQTAYAE